MSGPFIDIPDDSLGYWSPATASVDWCEANYAYVQRGECSMCTWWYAAVAGSDPDSSPSSSPGTRPTLRSCGTF